MRVRWRWMIPAAASASLLVAGIAGAAVPTGEAVTNEALSMPSAVESFDYPDAERILKEKNLKLKRGDGHIVLAECDSAPGLMRFIGRDREDFCFRTIGPKGYLTLEVPDVTGVQTADHKAHIEMIVDDRTKSYDVGKNAWEGIGETTDPESRDHVLVEIRTSK
ncbi:hypothetical protein [Streptomyces sp. FIT100]|uniref:hypothetical protein n=1 Tax=Streptomyces sp. FIT100 TaxID=2837956 RepID=UPI0021C72F6C|nr:hypothetical protein [Streptomyces sp. FIT100]UUN28103.1 hypothetical protein KK483_18205 [Streptomyces sp. FIT100]